MDFVDKKEEFADMLENFAKGEVSNQQLLEKVSQLQKDSDFKDKSLFENIFKELNSSLDELSNKEIKQRVLLIRSYVE